MTNLCLMVSLDTPFLRYLLLSFAICENIVATNSNTVYCETSHQELLDITILRFPSKC